MRKPHVQWLVSVAFAGAAGVAFGQTTYWQDDTCATMGLGDEAELQWCVLRVDVTAAGTARVTTTWSVSGLTHGTVDKGPDTNNIKMYLVDGRGARFDHVATEGAAAEGGRLSSGQDTLTGIFVFPPLGDATTLSFRDEDQGLTISGITLSETNRSDRASSASVLGRLMQTETLRIEYGWSGLGTRKREHYTLTMSHRGFAVEAEGLGGAAIPVPHTMVPAVDVEAVLTQLAQAPVLERDYVPRLTHTDDYPSIRIELAATRRTIVFYTQSQGPGHVPWAVESEGTVYVVPDDTPARALQHLDPFLGRDLATRARRFLEPHVSPERAQEVWNELEETLGTDQAYKTAFRLAETLGHEQDDEVWAALARYLEEQRAPPAPLEPVVSDGDSTLVRAARSDDRDTLRRLLANGVDPQEPSPLDGKTALFAAAEADHAEAVRVLLGAGADPNVRGRNGETALTRAAAMNRADSVAALLESKTASTTPVDVDHDGRDGKTALMRAAENGHARIVRALLSAGANPNLADSRKETPLMRTTSAAVARSLIRAGANVDATDDIGLTAMMNLFASSGTAFGDASRQRSGEARLGILTALLTSGANVEARDRQGRTSLIWATTGVNGTKSHPEALKLLIEHGANVDARDHKDGTALLYAALHGHLESARLLIDAGADVNAKMGTSTPLSFALDHSHNDLVTLLLRSGAKR